MFGCSKSDTVLTNSGVENRGLSGLHLALNYYTTCRYPTCLVDMRLAYVRAEKGVGLLYHKNSTRVQNVIVVKAFMMMNAYLNIFDSVSFIINNQIYMEVF